MCECALTSRQQCICASQDKTVEFPDATLGATVADHQPPPFNALPQLPQVLQLLLDLQLLQLLQLLLCRSNALPQLLLDLQLLQLLHTM